MCPPFSYSATTLPLFFFTDTATTEIYTLSLHDALPISPQHAHVAGCGSGGFRRQRRPEKQDRKSTRLNSSHMSISYAVFCLKKKKKHLITIPVLHAQELRMHISSATHQTQTTPATSPII